MGGLVDYVYLICPDFVLVLSLLPGRRLDLTTMLLTGLLTLGCKTK